MTALELGPGVVLAALLWSAGRVVAALIESRAWRRRDGCLAELEHHIGAVTVAVGDVLTELESIGRAVRDAVDRHDLK